MKCSQAENETVLWLYGEGEESHAVHVSTCEECQEVLKTHEAVQSCLNDSFTGTHLMATHDAPKIPVAANNNWFGLLFGFGGTAFAVAAIAMVWIGSPSFDGLNSVTGVVDGGLEVVATQGTVYWDFDGFGEEMDDVFDAFEDELAMLEEDLLTF